MNNEQMRIVEVLTKLRDELYDDYNRPEGRWGLHGHSSVDDDYFLALEYVIKRLDTIIVEESQAIASEGQAAAPDKYLSELHGLPVFLHPPAEVVRNLLTAAQDLDNKAKWINDEQATVDSRQIMEIRAALSRAKEAGL